MSRDSEFFGANPELQQQFYQLELQNRNLRIAVIERDKIINGLKVIIKEYEKNKMVQPLKRLGLSRATLSVLEAENIFTIKQLYSYSYDDLLAVPRLGEKRIEAINNKLQLFMLPVIKKRKVIKSARDYHNLPDLKKEYQKIQQTFDARGFFVEDLDLEPRYYVPLKRSGIYQIVEILKVDYDFLLDIKNFGLKARYETIVSLIEFAQMHPELTK